MKIKIENIAMKFANFLNGPTHSQEPQKACSFTPKHEFTSKRNSCQLVPSVNGDNVCEALTLRLGRIKSSPKIPLFKKLLSRNKINILRAHFARYKTTSKHGSVPNETFFRPNHQI